MRGLLFIDCAPFIGGAQESFATLLDAFPNSTVAVGDGLAPRFPNAIRIHARHWPATLSGLFQFLADRREASHILRPILRGGGNAASPQPSPNVLRGGGNAAEATPVLRGGGNATEATLVLRGGGNAAVSLPLIHANTLRSALLLTSLPISCPIVIHDRDIRAPRLAVRYVARRLRPTIIAISSTVAQKWRGVIPDENIHIIYNGFRLDEIRAAKPAQFPWSAPTVVLAADFISWKRHRLFIDAFALARQRIPNLHAVLRGRVRNVADEPYLNAIRDYASAIPNISIDTSSGAALGHIAASDMLVSCSENEPFGRTIIEAIALYKQVIATPTAAPPEFFKMLAPNLIMADDSPQAIADAIADNIHKQFSPISLDDFSVESMLAKIAAIHEMVACNCQQKP